MPTKLTKQERERLKTIEAMALMEEEQREDYMDYLRRCAGQPKGTHIFSQSSKRKKSEGAK